MVVVCISSICGGGWEILQKGGVKKWEKTESKRILTPSPRRQSIKNLLRCSLDHKGEGERLDKKDGVKKWE